MNTSTEGNQRAQTPTQMDRIEWMLHQILERLDGRKPRRATNIVAAGELPRMTTKQHATLQLMMQGKSNVDIGDALGVSNNTAKVHVRSIAKKLGVSTRSEICLLAERALLGIDERTYETLSGGLPKTWAEGHEAGTPDDPYRHLYAPDGGVNEREGGAS